MLSYNRQNSIYIITIPDSMLIFDHRWYHFIGRPIWLDAVE